MKRLGTTESGNQLVELEASDKDVIGRMITFLADLPLGLGGVAAPQVVAGTMARTWAKAKAAGPVKPPDSAKAKNTGCRACVVCGEALPKDAPPKKIVCSKRCSNAKYRAKNPSEPKPVRICPTCKKDFTPWRRDQKFCSDCAKKERAPGVPRVDKDARLEALKAQYKRLQIPPEPTDRGVPDDFGEDLP